jgi:hypothetical protein
MIRSRPNGIQLVAGFALPPELSETTGCEFLKAAKFV